MQSGLNPGKNTDFHLCMIDFNFFVKSNETRSVLWHDANDEIILLFSLLSPAKSLLMILLPKQKKICLTSGLKSSLTPYKENHSAHYCHR